MDTVGEIAKAAGFSRRRNALRHSYISYRIAQSSDVCQDALEAGNSPQVIFQHYREVVTPEAAAEWFAIVPGKPGNVVELKQPETGKAEATEPPRAQAQAVAAPTASL